MGSIFGGNKSKQKSVSDNQAYGLIKDTYSPLMSHTAEGLSGLSALLGGDATGFNNYLDATGFDAAAERGSRGITNNKAAAGLLRSGSAGKALQAFGQEMQQQYAGDYMDRLLGQAQLGLGVGQLISGAGQRNESTSKSKGKNGMGGFIGSMASGIAASDRALKDNVVYVGTLPNGLNLYDYTYLGSDTTIRGVMADEVAVKVPEALGPVVNGFMTVNYSKLEGINGYKPL
jgi:hypothetical protein